MPLYMEAGGVRGAYARILPQVLFIDWIVTPIVALCWGWLSFTLPPLFSAWNPSAPLASIAWMAARVGLAGLFYEVALTLVHIALHTPALYNVAHRMHHNGPQAALAGTYMTAWETSLNGAGLSFIGVALLGFPMPIVAILAALGRVSLARVHSGWRTLDRTGPREASFHGVHHTSMVGTLLLLTICACGVRVFGCG